jgi:hypothetical protein
VSHVPLHPYPFFLQTDQEQLVVIKDMDVNKHERLSNVALVKEQRVLRKDMVVNENEPLSKIILRHILS